MILAERSLVIWCYFITGTYKKCMHDLGVERYRLREKAEPTFGAMVPSWLFHLIQHIPNCVYWGLLRVPGKCCHCSLSVYKV